MPPDSRPVLDVAHPRQSPVLLHGVDARRRQVAKPRVEIENLTGGESRVEPRRLRQERQPARAARGSAPASCPAITMRPASGDDSPASSRSVVVLPLPLAPTSSVTSPARTEIESIEDAMAPYDLVSP